MSLIDKVKALWDAAPASVSGKRMLILDPAYNGSGNGKRRR